MKGNTRTKTPSYLCESCGHQSARWMGFCPQCRAQEALIEDVGAPNRRSSTRVAVVSATGEQQIATDREPTGIGELDRVLGGGLVPGSAILLGGEPGVGKSTLLLQVADALASDGGDVLIATAEESSNQVQMRSRRIGVASGGVQIASVYDVDDIIDLSPRGRFAALIVDSIQTVSTTDVSGSAGGVSQVRDSAARLIAHAKTTGMPVVLVGHVTKDGSIAGPRMLEHMVDVVLYLEGDPDRGLRFLRGIKNRYGSVNEVGVFDMTPEGLAEVTDPSRVLVEHRDENASGSVLFPMVEGKRPMVVEIQALVVKSEALQPRRAVNGIPAGRVHQILGVLERHAAMPLRNYEVYVHVMGGVRVSEPASDLPIALAVASAFVDVPLQRAVAWGELGLTGEIRPVGRSSVRLGEARRIGGDPIVAPRDGGSRLVDVLNACGLVPNER